MTTSPMIETDAPTDRYGRVKQALEREGYKMLGLNGKLAVGETYDTADGVGTLWRQAQQSDDVGNKLWIMGAGVNERGRRVGRMVRQVIILNEGDGRYVPEKMVAEYRDFETDELIDTVEDGDIEFGPPPFTVPFTQWEPMPNMPVDRFNLTRYLNQGFRLNPPDSLETSIPGVVVENPLLVAPLAGFQGTDEEKLGALVESKVPRVNGVNADESPTEAAVRHLANLDAATLRRALALAEQAEQPEVDAGEDAGSDPPAETTPFECQVCGKSVETERGLKIHNSRIHPPGA